jgi:hypothetical protein
MNTSGTQRVVTALAVALAAGLVLAAWVAGQRVADAAQVATFAPGVTVPAGTNAYLPIPGDFDRDGNVDFAVPNSGNNNASVRLGDGDGGFTFGATPTVGTNPIAGAAGDFDRDGDLDLAITNWSGWDVSILLGNGAGGFAAPVNYFSGGNPRSAAVADFDRDGKQDLIVANQWDNDNQVSRFLGNGAGAFGAAATSIMGTSPVCVVAADLDRDGKTDVVTANANSDDVGVRLGNGAGGFGALTRLRAGDQPWCVVVKDFDRDAWPDIAVSSYDSGDICVLLADRDGGFSRVATVTAVSRPAGMAAADFDRDGYVDLAVGNPLAGTVTVLTGDGAGGFHTAATLAAGGNPFYVNTADVDRDGRPDLLVSNSSSGTVSVFLNTTEDIEPPETTLVAAPAGPDGPAGFYVTAPQIGLSADETATTYYQWDDTAPGGWQSYATSITAADGTHTLNYFSTDSAGNTETARSETFAVDTTGPTGTMALAGGEAVATSRTVSVGCTVTDAASGMDLMRVGFGDGAGFGPWVPHTQSAVATLTAYDGTKTVQVECRDRAGHVLALEDTIRFVRPKATVYRPAVSPVLPRRYALATLYGYIAPRVAGSVKVYIYRRTSAGWVKYRGPFSVANRYVTNQNRSKWTYAFRPPYAGSWFCYVYWPGDGSTAANTSAKKYFSVR